MSSNKTKHNRLCHRTTWHLHPFWIQNTSSGRLVISRSRVLRHRHWSPRSAIHQELHHGSPEHQAHQRASRHRLRNIGNIREFLDQGSAETLVHCFVTSKIDYCNALLFGLPKYQINRLHLVLNTAARVVTLAYKYDHITPVMKSLHWLPVSQRITFKISLLIYKATQRLGTYLSIRPIGPALL